MTKDTKTKTSKKPVYVKLGRNGQVKLKEWRNEKGQLHREDGPALIVYDEEGNVTNEFYYNNGWFNGWRKPGDVFCRPTPISIM